MMYWTAAEIVATQAVIG